jgi:hypothetical protein
MVAVTAADHNRLNTGCFGGHGNKMFHVKHFALPSG